MNAMKYVAKTGWKFKCYLVGPKKRRRQQDNKFSIC